MASLRGTGGGRGPILAVLSLLLCIALAAAPAALAQQGGGKQDARRTAKDKQPQSVGAKQRPGANARRGSQQGDDRKEQATRAGEGDEDQDSGVWDGLFSWADDGGFGDNWLSGLGLALLGIVGALVTLYLFLGEFLPSMGGKADYEELRLEIDELARRRDQQLEPREDYVRGSSSMSAEERVEATKLTEDLNRIIERKERAASALRHSLAIIGFPLYVVLGGSFAVLFAGDALQALLIGFGWTAVADRFGLKRELDEKSRKRDEASGKLVDAAKEAEETKAKLAKVQKQLNEAQHTATTAIRAVAMAKQEESDDSTAK